jgi:NADH-quinone oxidoreductase subunit E
MVNWEFFDNQTPESAKQLVDDLRAGRPVRPTRGAPLCTYKETARILAGFPDERPGAVEASGGAGPASLVGLRLAKGDLAPAVSEVPRGTVPPQGEQPAKSPSAHDAPPSLPASGQEGPKTSASDPKHDAGPIKEPVAEDGTDEGEDR